MKYMNNSMSDSNRSGKGSGPEVEKENPSYLVSRLRSFGFAWSGIIMFFRNEKNAQIHLASTIIVVIISWLLHISEMEAVAIIFSVAIVWITEMINTAIEKVMDFITLEQLHSVKVIKDVAAGAVLVASIAAVLVGAIVFIPKIYHL